MRKSIIFLGVLFAGTSGLDVNAAPVPAFDAEKLFTRSTHVAVVEVLAEEVAPDTLERDCAGTVQVRVERRIEGLELPDELTVKTTRRYRPLAGQTPLSPGAMFLAFLVCSPDEGDWTLSDPHYGLMRVSRVRAETSVSEDVRGVVLAELRKSLEDTQSNVVESALLALTALRDRDAIPKAAAMTHGKDKRLAATALKLRFALGDSGGLEEAVRLIEGDSGLKKGEKDILAWSVTRKEANIPTDELNKLLLTSTYPALQRAVAMALSERGDRTSVDALITALSNPQLEVQYRCVAGLCRITERSGPASEEFMRNPEPTLNEWKRWWETEGMQKYGTDAERR